MKYNKPEFEIYEATCNTIREVLKSRLNGKVRVGVNHSDTLCVTIKYDGILTYQHYTENYLNYVLTYGSEKVANEIYCDFRKSINEKFFK